MKKIVRFILAGLMIVLMNSYSCSEDDDNDSTADNPTNGRTTAVFNTDVSYGTMTDRDGNIYKTVIIGTQTWMAENLRTTTYNDGSAIPNVTDDDEWENLTIGAYCNYRNTTSEDTIATCGRLYNWYAVNTGKLAPSGWHVPTDKEWTTLTDYLGSDSIAGGKLKEVGTIHWNSPNTEATNETGFTALPVGYRYDFGTFIGIGDSNNWWSATEFSTSSALLRGVFNNIAGVSRNCLPKNEGLSVRCVKD